MKFTETLAKFRNFSGIRGRLRRTFDDVIDSVLDYVPAGPFESHAGLSLVNKALFRRTVDEWCRNNPEAPARVVSIRPWDDSPQDTDGFDYGSATKREIIEVIRNQFEDSVLMTQLDHDVFVLFLTEETGSFVDNEFDWFNKLQGLKTQLEAEVPLSMHLVSAQWPRDATTATALLDRATPPETSVRALPLPTSARELEDALLAVLEVDVRREVEERLPESLRNSRPLARFLN